MKEKEATIYDVAALAGVSPATVSRVLNEPSKVNAEKRDLVLAAIEKLQFVPKASAVANARQSYKKIGVIAPFFTQPSFMQRLRGVSSVLSGQHYELVVYAIESTEELEAYIDMLVSSKRVDGLIILCLKLRENCLSKLRESGLPVCFVENEYEGFDSVAIDNFCGGELAAKFLYERGYRKPAFIGESSRRSYAVPATELRLEGFRSWFSKNGIELKGEHVLLGDFEEDSLDESVTSLFKKEDLPDCVFTSSDMIAIRLMRIASKNSIHVPDDISFIGFDNLDLAEYVNLTSVSQNLDETGKIAAELVLSRLKDRNRTDRKIEVKLEVIARTTTK